MLPILTKVTHLTATEQARLSPMPRRTALVNRTLQLALGLTAVLLQTGCPASDRILSAVAEKSGPSAALDAPGSADKAAPVPITDAAQPAAIRYGILWGAEKIGADPLVFAQQGIFARQYGEAIREYQICNQAPPLTAQALLTAGLLPLTSRSDEGQPMPYTEVQAPWSMYFVINNGVCSWQVNRQVLADSPPMIHSTLAVTTNQIDSYRLTMAVDRETALAGLPRELPRPDQPGSIASLPVDGYKYLQLSTDMRDARVRLLEDGLRRLVSDYLELQGQLPMSWDDLRGTLQIELSVEGGCEVVPSDAQWSAEQGGVALQVDSAAQFFRLISKPTAATTTHRLYRVVPHESGQGMTWVNDKSAPEATSWVDVVHIRTAT